MESSTITRRVQRVRHEPGRRAVTVAAVEPLGTQFVRVTFAGEALADFVSASFDDHIKFMFTDDSGETVRRDYTPRRHSRRERTLAIEFALHDHGAASDWARQAAPGQPAVIAGPKGSTIVPVDYDWHLLAGDATAMPAIRRRLEELPAGTRAIVLLQADRAQDRSPPASAATLQLEWAPGAEEFIAALGRLRLPDGEGYCWCAGEAAVMARARALLLQKGQPREALRVAAYWKHGASAFHENLDS